MKKSILFLAAAAIGCVSSSATVTFMSVEGAGEKDGSSWENAKAGSELAAVVKDMAAGDILCLQAGKYSTGLLAVQPGTTILGGFSPEMTGTDADIAYPSDFETVISGDTDGDGVGDNLTAALIGMDNSKGDAADYAMTKLAGLTLTECKYTAKPTYKGVSLFAQNVTAELSYLKFIANETTVGGGVVVLNGSKVYIHDCVWRDNKGTNAGVAMNIRQKGGTTTAGNQGSEIIVDRCEFTNNTVANPKSAGYGGAIALADNGGTLYMANSTVTGSHIFKAGAAARIGGGTTFYSIHNTWFDCTCNQTSGYNGAVLSIGTGAKFYSMADVVVNPTAKADDAKNAFADIFLQHATTEFTSGGYNLWSTVANNTAAGTLAESDNVSAENTIASVFGENKYTDKKHTKVIAPAEGYRKVPVADVKAKAEEWQLPAQIDLSCDQLGETRPSVTLPGAYDPKDATVTGIEAVAAPAAEKLELVALGAGCYRIDGAQGAAEVYDLTGRLVFTARGEVINLSSLRAGIYVVRVASSAVTVKL